MGKITEITWAGRPDQVRQLKTGPVSIVTGANLRCSSQGSSEQPKAADNDVTKTQLDLFQDFIDEHLRSKATDDQPDGDDKA